MAKATYFQRGDALDYKNIGVTTIEAGTIIVLAGNRIGIAGCDIPVGAVGTIFTEGCFYMNFAAPAAAPIDIGAPIYLNNEQLAQTVGGAGTVLAGYAAASVIPGDTKVLVKINALDTVAAG